MILFQVLAIGLLVPWASAVLYGAIRHGRRRNLLLFVLLASAIAAVADPELTQTAARALGIGRGADLVLYATSLLTIGCLFLIVYVYRRLRLQITELTRQLALAQLEAQPPSHGPVRWPGDASSARRDLRSSQTDPESSP